MAPLIIVMNSKPSLIDGINLLVEVFNDNIIQEKASLQQAEIQIAKAIDGAAGVYDKADFGLAYDHFSSQNISTKTFIDEVMFGKRALYKSRLVACAVECLKKYVGIGLFFGVGALVMRNFIKPHNPQDSTTV